MISSQSNFISKYFIFVSIPLYNRFSTLEDPETGTELEKLQLKSDGKVQLAAAMSMNSSTKFKFVAEDGRHEPGKPLNSYGKVISIRFLKQTNKQTNKQFNALNYIYDLFVSNLSSVFSFYFIFHFL